MKMILIQGGAENDNVIFICSRLYIQCFDWFRIEKSFE